MPVSLNAARAVLGPNPTREQLAYHYGSPGRVFEKVCVSWLGPLFVGLGVDNGLLGGFEGTVIGSLAVFYFVWGPALASLQRGKWSVNDATDAAIFFGRVADVDEAVDDTGAQTIELTVDDGSPRHRYVLCAPWRNEYADVAVGMDAQLLVLTRRAGRRAKTLLVSECYVPAAKTYVGEYPDLNRKEFVKLLARAKPVFARKS